MEEEIWKDIEDYEGLYKVSNMGRVKSLNYRRTGKEGILKARDNGNGYLYVFLCKEGIKKTYYVHRLVATAFIENPEGYTEVNHIDENKENNCMDNLEWVTCKENINHGTHNKRSSESRINHPKTSKPIIGIDVRTGLIVEFTSVHEAERETGIDNGNIIRCCQGKYKTSGGFYWMYK